MEALIYTKDDSEYEKLKTMLLTEAPSIGVFRDPLNGHNYFSREYDVVIIALNGAQGMELVLEYSRRFYDTRIIWITDDPYFAGTAIRQHIYDFFQRPYDDAQLANTVREAVQKCPNKNVWKYTVNKRKEQ